MNNLLIPDQGTCNACRRDVVIDHKNGKIRCTACGLLKEDRFIDLTSEYRFFMENTSPSNDPRRGGNIVNIHLDSQIDIIEIDAGKSYFKRIISHIRHSKQFR